VIKEQKTMSLADALFPKTRQRVLGLLYSAPERELYMREIARLTGVTVSSIQRELDQLSRAGILLETKRGNQRVFRANRDCPLYEELVGFAIKTYGLADLLREAVRPFHPQRAFIFGSLAKKTDRASSDVDVLVTGDDLDYSGIMNACLDLQQRIGRTINVKVFRADEYRREAAKPDSFIARIGAEPMIDLIKGDEHGVEAGQPA
jgi:predicted nucleotidyltransferase